MSLTDIKRIIEKRKYNLTSVLQSGRNDIDLSRQHQMYGAIKELENVLRTIEHYYDQEIKLNYPLNLRNELETPILERISKRINLTFKKKIKINSQINNETNSQIQELQKEQRQ